MELVAGCPKGLPPAPLVEVVRVRRVPPDSVVVGTDTDGLDREVVGSADGEGSKAQTFPEILPAAPPLGVVQSVQDADPHRVVDTETEHHIHQRDSDTWNDHLTQPCRVAEPRPPVREDADPPPPVGDDAEPQPPCPAVHPPGLLVQP